MKQLDFIGKSIYLVKNDILKNINLLQVAKEKCVKAQNYAGAAKLAKLQESLKEVLDNLKKNENG